MDLAQLRSDQRIVVTELRIVIAALSASQPTFALPRGFGLTKMSLLCYNSNTEQGQMFWVTAQFAGLPGMPKAVLQFLWCPMVSINPGIRAHGLESD
jgi:hypothetical protein